MQFMRCLDFTGSEVTKIKRCALHRYSYFNRLLQWTSNNERTSTEELATWCIVIVKFCEIVSR